MRYAIRLEAVKVDALVFFERVDLGSATSGKARVAAMTPVLYPEWIAVRVPSYTMQMGRYAFTIERIPSHIKVLRVISREDTTFEVESLLDVPVRPRHREGYQGRKGFR